MAGKGKPGPAILEVNEDLLLELGKIQCTYDEIAAVLGISRRTLYTRLEEKPELRTIIEKARDEGRSSLRRAQWKSALSGNTTMQIWLGKQHLGQKDQGALDLTLDKARPIVIHKAGTRPEDVIDVESEEVGDAIPGEERD